jgi:electron-transferring-flavoprotein dehydrogenase
MRQLAAETNTDLSVCLIEKGPHVGAHILSGNVFQPKGLNELFPNWKELGVTFNGYYSNNSGSFNDPCHRR